MLPSALLFLLPVVVVDVTGDRLDPAHTRELVEHELSVTAVAPDDPRASEATGRIEITGDGAAKKLTVTYRKLDEPIERTIELADERSRAESDAALLAGNLARDEASELAPSPVKTPPVTGRPVQKGGTSDADDQRRLSELRGVLGRLSAEERSNAVRGGVVSMTGGALMVGGGVYVFATGDMGDPRALGFATAMTGLGAALAVVGAVVLVAKPDAYAPLAKTLREEEAKGSLPGLIVERVDKEWRREVEEEKTMRDGTSIFNFVIGGLSLAAAGAVIATDSDRSVPVLLLISGGLNIAAGIAVRAIEGKLERSYRLWRTVGTSTPEPGPRVSFGAAPTTGGGAASFALAF